MGIFDFLKSKTPEEKASEQKLKIRNKIKINETKSLMESLILSAPHDDSMQDENPNGIGEFGLKKTNPIPVNGTDNIDAYMDKIRYEYTSKKTGTNTFNQISHVRTSDSDNTKIGSEMPKGDLVQSSTNCDNIKGTIDVYNLYSVGGKKLAKIYVNSYSLKTSNKIPKGFIHRDKTDPAKDSAVLMYILKNMKN